MPLVGFGPTAPASEPPQTHAIDPAATGIGVPVDLTFKKLCSLPAQCGHVFRSMIITNRDCFRKIYQSPLLYNGDSVCPQ